MNYDVKSREGHSLATIAVRSEKTPTKLLQRSALSQRRPRARVARVRDGRQRGNHDARRVGGHLDALVRHIAARRTGNRALGGEATTQEMEAHKLSKFVQKTDSSKESRPSRVCSYRRQLVMSFGNGWAFCLVLVPAAGEH